MNLRPSACQSGGSNTEPWPLPLPESHLSGSHWLSYADHGVTQHRIMGSHATSTLKQTVAWMISFPVERSKRDLGSHGSKPFHDPDRHCHHLFLCVVTGLDVSKGTGPGYSFHTQAVTVFATNKAQCLDCATSTACLATKKQCLGPKKKSHASRQTWGEDRYSGLYLVMHLSDLPSSESLCQLDSTNSRSEKDSGEQRNIGKVGNLAMNYPDFLLQQLSQMHKSCLLPTLDQGLPQVTPAVLLTSTSELGLLRIVHCCLHKNLTHYPQ